MSGHTVQLEQSDQLTIIKYRYFTKYSYRTNDRYQVALTVKPTSIIFEYDKLHAGLQRHLLNFLNQLVADKL